MNWENLWKNKTESFELEENGFDSSGSKIENEEKYEIMRKTYCDLISQYVPNSSSVLEIGCGSGPMISRLKKRFPFMKAHGVDLSPSLISIAAKRYKDISFYVSKADSIFFDKSRFDVVFCFSIFQYFDNLEYAEKVFDEMVRVCKPNGTILILDVPDIEKKIESESKRSRPSEHLFYSKEFFNSFSDDIKIVEIKLGEYENSKFRFNVIKGGQLENN
jgi:ubiquinone/menaquinone biosynthesis C-methylase UbiE